VEVFSPFTHLMELFGYEQALMALVDAPKLCHEALTIFTQNVLAQVQLYGNHRPDAILVSSAFAGAGFISRQMYGEFVMPYEDEVFGAIRQKGCKSYVHTCGAIGDRLARASALPWAEAQRIAVATLIAYPGLHARMAAKAALDQFVSFATGDEIVSWTWHTHSALEQFAPQTYPAFRAARQQQAPIDFSIMNTIHVPAAWLAIAGLPIILLAATRRRVPLRAAALAVTVLLALVGNAIICGALSNPHDRYQSRLVPLAPLAVAIAALSYRRRGARVPDV
jgi:hypothetical protein